MPFPNVPVIRLNILDLAACGPEFLEQGLKFLLQFLPVEPGSFLERIFRLLSKASRVRPSN